MSTTMFILQTSTAVLLAFMVLLAYSQVRDRLAKSGSRRKDLRTPGSSIKPISDPVEDFTGMEILSDPSKKEPTNKEMEAHKQLYYKLHNLERHPEILPECRQLLLSLLSTTLTEAFKTPEPSILSIPTFSRTSLNDFLKAKDTTVTTQYEAYVTRRRAGAPREMFATKPEAEWWLKQSAPVKFVDGAWLGHIHKTSTPFAFRNITKNAWQVLSEELGDGDVIKNHVHVYRALMHSIGADLPRNDDVDFIHARHALDSANVWKAAVAQLVISLFPHDFMGEVLGFNLAYESLPLHLLKTVKELRELGLSAFYFELHISIDNADSGHAAMAVAAVCDYIDLVGQREGEEAAGVAWRRVQAGYVLAEGLGTTPKIERKQSRGLVAPAHAEEAPLYVNAKQYHHVPKTRLAGVKPEDDFRITSKRTEKEGRVLEVFARKTLVAHKIHCNSRLRIGKRLLVEWLEPNAFTDVKWQKDFLEDLSNCKPWVVKGESSESRLIKELSWEGKMFGSFTQTEVEIVKAWIDELGEPDGTAYFEFTGRDAFKPLAAQQDILADYPVLLPRLPAQPDMSTTDPNVEIDAPPAYTFDNLNITNFLPLWFASQTLLESLPSLPIHTADTFGSAIVRVLRAQMGFDVDGAGVAGMDEVHRTDRGHAIGIIELGFRMCHCAGLKEPENLRAVVALGDAETVVFAEWMAWMGMRWLAYRDVLVGMAWAFMEIHEMVAGLDGECGLLDQSDMRILKGIARSERVRLQVCRREIVADAVRTADFRKGVAVGRRAIEACFKK
jgi:hypothetical protein